MKNIKRFLFASMMLFAAVQISAQTQKYNAFSYAFATINSYGRYTWSDWMKCSVNIYFNLDSDVITIYSKKIQKYVVYDYTDPYSDGGGGTTVKFYVIDNEYDKGEIRIRIEKNGNSQLYVDFADVAWVYNVTRIY